MGSRVLKHHRNEWILGLMENNLLLTGVDFGGVSPLSLEELKTNLESISDEKECILLIAEIFKKGDFSVKPLLIELMNQTKDESVLNLCIRLFCSICTNEDLRDVSNLRCLSDASEFAIFTFITGAVDTMSYEIVPYLLALWDEWEDSNSDIEYAIKDALDNYFYDQKLSMEEATKEEVEELWMLVGDQKELDTYYYKGGPVFPGMFAKEIMTSLYTGIQAEGKFHKYLQSALLSTFTGKRVPVKVNEIISRRDIDSMIDYIEDVSKRDWVEGRKYFYGFEIK